VTRAVRILMVANDGLSAGHVARTVAIARGLRRCQPDSRVVVVTTSEADGLLGGLAVVRMPAPATARLGGLADAERRRLAAAIVDGVLDGFAPDVVVADTFAAGPHGELAHVGKRARRAVVRRAVVDDDALRAGLADQDVAIVADDPTPLPVQLPMPVVRVPPIVLGEPMLARDDARRALGLGAGRVVLIASGGGGDGDAAARADIIAAAIARVGADVRGFVARGPLDRRDGGPRAVPLQRYLRAFDAAFSPAGYNTAHELAAARVPTVLFAQPRPFDDQAARAARFAAAGHARVLDRFDDDAIAQALAWLQRAEPPALRCDGADRAAAALVALATGQPP
jgi:predicted glycosyltransferase